MRRPLVLLVVYALLAGIVLAPFLSVSVPAFGDTLNHLARMHILVSLRDLPDLQRYYSVHWAPIPYLAMDAVVPLLMRVMPVYLAGKMFVCACVVMPVLGTSVLHYAVHRRFSLIPAASFLLCTNYLLALGFLNYLFSAGFAVMLFAGWIAAASWPRWWRACAFAPLVLLLYLGHAFACLAYCLSVAGYEAARALRGGPGAVWNIVAAAAQAVPALLFAGTLHVSVGYVGALVTDYGSLPVKLMALASPMLLLIDQVYAATILVAAAGFVCARRWLVFASPVWPAAVAVGVAAIAMPHVLSSTWGMDLRLPLIVAMLLIGGVSWSGSARARWPVCAILLALVGVRSADAWTVLHKIDARIADHRRVLAALPHGARLLVVGADDHGTGLEQVTASTAWHMPLVAVIDRDAFVPYVFNGLTTIRINPAWRLSSTPNGLPVSLAQLRAGAMLPDDGIEHGDGQGARDYARGWPAKFDYVLVQAGYVAPGPLPGLLVPVAGSPDLALYRVTAAGAPAGSRSR